VKNSVLVYQVNEASPAADVSVEMPRKTLEDLAVNPSASPADIVVTSGDSAVFDEFIGMFDEFDPGFNISIP